jgi:hypothetical protein
VYFYELHEGDGEVYADLVLVHEAEYEPEEFFELVQSIRRRIKDSFEHDTLIEAIAAELEREHEFTAVTDDKLATAVNVSTVEEQNFLIKVESQDPDDEDAYEIEPDVDYVTITAELEHVAVADPIGLALGAKPAGLPRLGHRAKRQQVVVRNRFGPDETPREIRVDRSRGVDRRRSIAHRPRPHLVRARGEERDEAQEAVAQSDDPSEARLLQPELLHEHARVVRLELAELHLDLRRERVDERLVMGIVLRDALDQLGGTRQISFADVEQDENGLLGEEPKAADRLLFVRLELDVANRPLGLEGRLQLPDDDLFPLIRLALRSRPMTPAGTKPLEAPVDEGQVGQGELQVELVEVTAWIDRARGVRQRRIVERPHDMDECVGLAEAGEVFGRQLLGPDPTLRRRRRRREVDVRDVCLDDFLRLEDLGEPVEAVVGHLHDADVELHPPKPARVGVAAGEGVEHGGLAGPGETDDRDLHPQMLPGGLDRLPIRRVTRCADNGDRAGETRDDRKDPCRDLEPDRVEQVVELGRFGELALRQIALAKHVDTRVAPEQENAVRGKPEVDGDERPADAGPRPDRDGSAKAARADRDGGHPRERIGVVPRQPNQQEDCREHGL